MGCICLTNVSVFCGSDPGVSAPICFLHYFGQFVYLTLFIVLLVWFVEFCHTLS